MKKFTLMLLMVFAMGVTSVMAQGRTLSGKVYDKGSKQPVIGATIIVQGTQNGGYSMEGGEFVIANVEGAVNLEVSFMGYKDAIVKVAASATTVDVALTPSAMQMDEVVVVAFGKADKKSLTGSVAVVSADKIESRPVTSVTSAIAGSAPGIQATSASGAPGSAPAIRVRGVGSINSSNTPLYVVDGLPFSGDISTISADDIASMSILKDAASTALYGSKASNGVVMIQTKGGRKEKVQFNVKINEGIMFRAQPEYEKVGAADYYTLGWESFRNDLYFAGKGYTLEQANATASKNVFDSQSWYNVMRDKNTGIQIPDNQVVVPTQWEGAADGWKYGVINPNAEIMPGYDDLDWFDAVSGIGFRQNYNITASGGSDKANYYGSVGYLNEDSYFEYTDYERLNARLKLDVKPTKYLKFGTNIAASYTQRNNPFSDSSSGYMNPWYFARSIAPIYPVYMHDDATGEYILDAAGNKQFDQGYAYEDGTYTKRQRGYTPGRHVIMEGSLNSAKRTRATLFGQVYAEVTFLKDFKFTVDASMNHQYNWFQSYDNGIIGDGAPGGRMADQSYRNLDYNFKQILNWERQFGDHNIDVMLGHENFELKYHQLTANKNSQIAQGIYELSNFATIADVSGYSHLYHSEGYFGRVNYNYKEKYYVSGSYRRDGSSRFAPDRRWGNFWSVGGSWIISAEDFMMNATWVDMLKFRVSYGTNGNDGGFGQGSVSYYASQPLYYFTDNGGVNALAWSTDGSPLIQWETQGALDMGVDFRFFNRFNGQINYFRKSSDELIFDRPLPVSSGSTSVTENIGAMFNHGLELAFDVDAIRSRDWLWNIGLNASWIQNEITRLPEENKKEGIISGSKKLMEGHGIYDYWLRQYAGIDPQDGATYYKFDDGLDAVGNAKFEWDPANNADQFEQNGQKYTKTSGEAIYDWSGSAMPTLFGSVTTSLTWKNLSLDVLFTYSLGGKSMDYAYNGLLGADYDQSMSIDNLNSWRKPGDISDLPRLQESDGGNLYATSTNQLVSSSYLALQNVTLSYNFPKKIANKLTLSGLSVYVSGENLFQVSARKGFDATASFNGTSNNSRFGSVAVFTLGVNVSF